VADVTNDVIWTLRRSDGAVTDTTGRNGRNAGQFQSSVHTCIDAAYPRCYLGARGTVVGSYLAGLMTGCLLGVSGTFLILFLVSLLPEKNRTARGISSRGFTFAILIILGLAFVVSLHPDKAVSVLIFFLSVLAIAQIFGQATSLAASALAAVALILPSVGGLRIEQPRDQLLLVLFLLGAMIGSRLIVKAKKLAEQDS